MRTEWAGNSVANWHHPIGRCMTALLDAGFLLRHVSEPGPVGDISPKAERYRNVPNFLIKEWERSA